MIRDKTQTSSFPKPEPRELRRSQQHAEHCLKNPSQNSCDCCTLLCNSCESQHFPIQKPSSELQTGPHCQQQVHSKRGARNSLSRQLQQVRRAAAREKEAEQVARNESQKEEASLT